MSEVPLWDPTLKGPSHGCTAQGYCGPLTRSGNSGKSRSHVLKSKNRTQRRSGAVRTWETTGVPSSQETAPPLGSPQGPGHWPKVGS